MAPGYTGLLKLVSQRNKSAKQGWDFTNVTSDKERIFKDRDARLRIERNNSRKSKGPKEAADHSAPPKTARPTPRAVAGPAAQDESLYAVPLLGARVLELLNCKAGDKKDDDQNELPEATSELISRKVSQDKTSSRQDSKDSFEDSSASSASDEWEGIPQKVVNMVEQQLHLSISRKQVVADSLIVERRRSMAGDICSSTRKTVVEVSPADTSAAALQQATSQVSNKKSSPKAKSYAKINTSERPPGFRVKSGSHGQQRPSPLSSKVNSYFQPRGGRVTLYENHEHEDEDSEAEVVELPKKPVLCASFASRFKEAVSPWLVQRRDRDEDNDEVEEDAGKPDPGARSHSKSVVARQSIARQPDFALKHATRGRRGLGSRHQTQAPSETDACAKAHHIGFEVASWSSQRDSKRHAAKNLAEDCRSKAWQSALPCPQWIILDVQKCVEVVGITVKCGRGAGNPKDLQVLRCSSSTMNGPWVNVKRCSLEPVPTFQESIRHVLEFDPGAPSRYWMLIFHQCWDGDHVSVQAPLMVLAKPAANEEWTAFGRRDSLSSFFHESMTITQDESKLRQLAKQIGVKLNFAEQIKSVFEKYDSSKSGSLCYADFAKVVRSILVQVHNSDRGVEGNSSFEIPERRLQSLWFDVDADGSGRVELGEFMVWYCNIFHSQESPKKSFHSTRMAESSNELYYARLGQNRMHQAGG